MANAKLTEPFVANLAVPKGKKEIFVWDTELPGFGVRKLSSGRTTYVVDYRIGRQQRKLTLGIAALGKLKAMRNSAHEVLSKARLGQDTSGELKAAKEKVSSIVGELVPRYLAACRPSHKPRSFEEKNRHLTKHWVPLHKLAIEDVTRRRIIGELDKIAESSGPVAADRAKASLSSFLAWCVERDYIEINPVGGISKRAGIGARERVLSKPELVTIWKACNEPFDYPRIVRLLILTGQRRDEIGGLRWSEIDFDRRQIELPPARTKNKRPHVIPLSDAAIAILRDAPRAADRDYVFGRGDSGFSGWSKAKAQLDGSLPIEMRPNLLDQDGEPLRDSNGDLRLNPKAWRLHDLRRTFVTMTSELGFAPPHVMEAIVNHISGAKAGVAGVYNRAAYAAEKRQALDLWGAHVTAIVDGQHLNVVAMRTA